MKINLKEVRMPLSSLSLGELNFYQYQKEAIDKIIKTKRGFFVISAATGMGKTAIGVASTLLGNWEKTLAIYPTNELIKNQKKSIEKLVKLMGREKTEIEEIYRHKIEAYIDQDQTIYSKPQAVIDLLKGSLTKNKRFILTNPDTLHLIIQLRYGSKKYATKNPAHVLNALTDYRTLIIDEFHYYRDRMLNNLLIDLVVAISIGMFDRIILMTATPDKIIFMYLEELAKLLRNKNQEIPLFLFNQKENVSKSNDGSIVATYPVELELLIGQWDNTNEITDKIYEISSKLKKGNNKDVIPLCIIVNSVIQARKISTDIREKFNISEIHGLVPQLLRKITNQTQVVVGTNAIEVGIDFDTERLIFEANESASFLQRLGRAARKRPSKVWAIVPQYVYNFISRKIKDNSISKYDFSELVQEAFLDKEQKYLDTIYSQYESWISIQRICRRLDDSKVSQGIINSKMLETVGKKVFNIDSFQMMKFETKNPDICFKKESFQMFRDGEPSILVYDVLSERLNFFPFYFSPVSRVIYRAEKIITILRNQEVYSKLKKVSQNNTIKDYKEAYGYILSEIKSKMKRKESLFMVKITGYISNRRMAFLRFVKELSTHDSSIGINKMFLGAKDLELTSNSPLIDEIGEIFEDQLYVIVPPRYMGELDWRTTKYVVKSMVNQISGRVFFGSDCLVALAYMSKIKEKKEFI